MKQAAEVSVVIEGHCDERGTEEYNLALGEKRAATILTYLKNLGVETARMLTRSLGENVPLCSEPTEECWAKNRRAEFVQSMKK